MFPIKEPGWPPTDLSLFLSLPSSPSFHPLDLSSADSAENIPGRVKRFGTETSVLSLSLSPPLVEKRKKEQAPSARPLRYRDDLSNFFHPSFYSVHATVVFSRRYAEKLAQWKYLIFKKSLLVDSKFF